MSTQERTPHTYNLGESFPLFTKKSINDYTRWRKQIVDNSIFFQLPNFPVLPFTILGNPHFGGRKAIQPVDAPDGISGQQQGRNPPSNPVHLSAESSNFNLAKIGLSKHEKIKDVIYDDMYTISEELLPFIGRLRFQVIFPNGLIFQSLPNLYSLLCGNFIDGISFDKFHPLDQSPNLVMWLDHALDFEISQRKVGRSLDVFAALLHRVPTRGQFVLTDENTEISDFLSKAQRAHLQHRARYIFASQMKDQFYKTHTKKLHERYIYRATDQMPLEQLFIQIGRAYQSPHVVIRVRKEQPLSNRINIYHSISPINRIISDGKCFLVEDHGSKGMVAGLEGISYYALLRNPEEPADLMQVPWGSTLEIVTTLRKRDLLACLKAQNIPFPENFRWIFERGVARRGFTE